MCVCVCVCVCVCKMWDKLEKLLYSGVYGYTYMHTFILISYMHRAFYKVLFTYHLILIVALRGRYYYPYFTDEKLKFEEVKQ